MASNSGNQVREKLQVAFAEFNRQSRRSKGRRYPPQLQKMVREAAAAGLSKSELMKLTGMSDSAMRYAVGQTPAKAKPQARTASVRRLEVVSAASEPLGESSKLTIRLPSGVVIQGDVDMIVRSGILASLVGGVHASSC